MIGSDRDHLLDDTEEEKPRVDKCATSCATSIIVSFNSLFYIMNNAMLSNQYNAACLQGAADKKLGIPEQISPLDLNLYIEIAAGAGLVLSPIMTSASAWVVSRGYELLNKTKFGLGIFAGMATTGILFLCDYQFKKTIYAEGYDVGFTNVTAATLSHICITRKDESIPVTDTLFKITPVVVTSLLALSHWNKWRSRGAQNQQEVAPTNVSRMEP